MSYSFNVITAILLSGFLSISCSKSTVDVITDEEEILGFDLLQDLSGHWIGSNQTPFGHFDWFTFDFRPISASHLHSIYEGATNQNIITSLFVADFEGKKQIMARNGGWLGDQYRATYFVLDKSEKTDDSKYYRLVDAVGREKRAYIEFRFENDSLYFDAYKDNSGSLDEPVHHMGFRGANRNPSFAQSATESFAFPRKVSEIDLEGRFDELIDPNTAMFLEESQDPFPKSDHGYLSDLAITISKVDNIADAGLLLYLSKEPIVNANGTVNYPALDDKLIRTIRIKPNEATYTATYLHPDTYYVTVFADLNGDYYPSAGDVTSISEAIEVTPESLRSEDVEVNTVMR